MDDRERFRRRQDSGFDHNSATDGCDGTAPPARNHFETERADNARYPDTAFYDLQSHMGMTNTAAEQGTTLFADQTTREVGSPDGDTHLPTIKQFARDELREHFDEVNQELFEKLTHNECGTAC